MSQQLWLCFCRAFAYNYSPNQQALETKPCCFSIVLSLLTWPWVDTNFALSWEAQETFSLLGKWCFFFWPGTGGWHTLFLLKLKPAAFCTASLSLFDLCLKQSQAPSHPWRQKGEHEEMQPWEHKPLLPMLPRTVCLSKHHSCCACRESWLVLPPFRSRSAPVAAHTSSAVPK